jgi:transposase InsO family protein
MNDDDKKAIALWRLGVLGPLISARLEHGDRKNYFEEAATRTLQEPSGRWVQISARTVEAWFYAYREGGFEALFPRTRSDRHKSRSIDPQVADILIRAKREKPRRSIRRIIRMLERARIVRPGELSRASAHRLLMSVGASKRPVRGPSVERRSYIFEHVSDLWIGDALHGPLVIGPDRQLHKAYLLSQIDSATRYLPHSYFALSEGAIEQEHGFKQALLKHGRPRAYYVDRGSAYKANSLRMICAELGIRHLMTAPKDCEAKGVIERWHRTWREEVGDELPDHPLTLAELNSKHWAWIAAEYHTRKHDTTGRAPKEHWLSDCEHLLKLSPGKNLDEVFLHREKRKVRKDGTVRFRGRLLEVQPEWAQKWVELRFDPKDEDAMPRVFVENRFVCDTVVLDRLRNAHRARRRNLATPDPFVEKSGLDPLALIEDEHYRRTHPPTHEEESE